MNSRELLSQFKLNSSYFKWLDKENRRETWEEACDRVFDMHQTKFQKAHKSNSKFREYFEFAKQAYKDKLVLASMRSLQFGGESILKHNAKMFNCLSSYCDRVKFFNECMYWLLCGCGVGFSVQTKHINKLPNIKQRNKRTKTFVISDDIEGWSNSIGVLLSSYFEGDVPFPTYQGNTIHFDFSKIRGKGSYISGGFKAPGPDGLRNALIKIEALLEKQFNNSKTAKISSIVAYDMALHMSDAVLSGGVRRSAMICLFSPDDEEMLNAKTGNWYNENPQRARANNSVLLVRNKTTRKQFNDILERVKQWGEPGFIWSEHEDIIYNPCGEIAMYPQTQQKVSGFQGCNLIEGNGAECKTKEEFMKMCKAAAIIGTMQAGYTDFKYVSKESKEIFDREALLGCSITGMMNNPDICFDPEIQREGAELIKRINKEVAQMICINPAARCTCVKPSGNASVALGCSSGIHGEHSKRYFRNVQVNKDDDIGKFFAKVNPDVVEESVWSANNTDWVFSFPVMSSDESIYKSSLLGLKQLGYVKLTQQNWVEYGTNEELCTFPGIRHNVSNTISVDNWDEVGNYIYENKAFLAGVSLLSSTGDRDYPQAPFTAVYTPQETLERYGDATIFASGLIVDGLQAFNNNLWEACNQVLGNGKHNLEQKTAYNALMRDWIRRAKQFSVRYFKNDLEMTYCLKDVHNYHKWMEVTRELKEIDWNKLDVQPEYIDIDTLSAMSCSGGACEII